MKKTRGMMAFTVIAIAMCLYQLSSVMFPIFSPVEHSNIHLSFALTLIFLWAFTEAKSMAGRVCSLFLIVLALAGPVYVMVQFETLTTKIGLTTLWGTVFGAILIIMCLEACRRTLGIALPIVATMCILYASYGSFFPGFFNHAGFEWDRLIASLTTNFTGIYGSILDISATFLVLFMIFGGMLESSGAGRFFIDLAMAIGGKSRSGPAQAAVIGSGLVGSINGSAVANVATTGVFTIPMMKKCGYAPEMAGAIESVASTGGMLMPPVMGVAAFVMAGITGIPYPTIALAALIPALLYYFTIGASVHLYACKHGFKPMDEALVPKLGKVLWEGFHFLIPLGVIVAYMTAGMSVTRAGFNGIISLVLVMLIRNSISNPKYVFSKDFWNFIVDGFVSGAKSTMGVAAACAIMGAMSQAIIISGLAFKIVFFIKAMSGGAIWIPVCLTIGITIFFGMGIPTTASYIMVAVIGAPALVDIGFPLLAVHLFIYYYSILANITPPVCAAVMVGSKLADANYIKTGITAVRLGMAGFILPLVFLFHPELLIIGEPFAIFTVSVSAFFGMFCMAVFFEGYLWGPTAVYERLAMGCAAVLLIYPGNKTDMIGYCLLALVLLSQYYKYKRPKTQAAQTVKETEI